MFATIKERLSESQALEVGNFMLLFTMKSLKSVSLVELVVRDGLLELVEGHVHLVHPLPLTGVRSLPPGFVRFGISSQIYKYLKNHMIGDHTTSRRAYSTLHPPS